MAWGEPVRLVRWLNVPVGLARVAVPSVSDPVAPAGWSAVVAGLVVVGMVVVGMALPRGPKRESYGSRGRFVK